MPRGDNPNSRKALLENRNSFNTETAQEANKKSLESKRKLKTFKELDAENTSDEQRMKMLEMIMRKASMGNIKAFEVYRDTVGLKPIDKIVVAEVDQSTIDDVESIFNG